MMFRRGAVSSSSSSAARSSMIFSALATAALTASCRAVHQSLPLPRQPVLADQRLETAKAALLQLNVMVAQGIEPDALMYTNLIATVGRAGLEWQAFKLFSRMLEQGVQPLPETYVALKRATRPSRRRVIEQLEQKLVEAAVLLPQQLATAMSEQTEADRRAADRSMRHMTKPDSFSSGSVPPAAASAEDDADAAATKKSEFDDDDADADAEAKRKRKIREAWDQIPEEQRRTGEVPTMRIDSVEAVMATIQHLGDRQRHAASVATGERRQSLLQRLEKLHEQELRILLTIHRQSRVGDRQQLLRRVVTQVPAAALEAMLDRRAHYFDSVKQALELQIEELKQQEAHEAREKQAKLLQQQREQEQQQAQIAGSDPSGSGALVGADIDDLSALALQSSLSASAKDHSVAVVNDDEDDDAKSGGGRAPTDASALTPRERYDLAPPYLETPWGLLRKPPVGMLGPEAGVGGGAPNPERDEAMLLTQQEYAHLENCLAVAAGSNNNASSFDAVPTQMLRRYCRHFRLKWKRGRGRAQLQDLVEWHLRNFKPAEQSGDAAAGSNDDTTTVSRAIVRKGDTASSGADLARIDAEQLDRRAQQQTLDQYNTLLAVANATENMTMVDDAAVSRAVIEQRQHERYMKKAAQREREKALVEKRRQDLERAAVVLPTADSMSADTGDASSPLASEQNRLQQQQHSGPSAVLLTDSDDASPEGKSRSGSGRGPTRQQTQELPPWAAMTSPTPLNLRTGRFDVGVPHAEFFEDGTGRLKVRQPMQLRDPQRYTVDEALLPKRKQAALQEQRLREQEREDAAREADAERQERRQRSARARRFDKFMLSKRTKAQYGGQVGDGDATSGGQDRQQQDASGTTTQQQPRPQQGGVPRRMAMKIGRVPFPEPKRMPF